MRTVVIGAGAGGLAVAHYLAKEGHRDVTVLEREDRVGGKCCTIDHEGRSFELGAGVLSRRYSHVRALMREVGVDDTLAASGFFFDPDRDSTTFLVPSPARRRWGSLARETASCLAAIWRERGLRRPGFAATPRELCRPFEEWAAGRGFAEVVEMIRPWFTGFGYGYLRDVPAAYVLKYMTLWGFPLSELMAGGFQGLWERVARGLRVRRGVDVRRVTRDGAGVRVETETETMRFDRMILACPLDRALAFLDASDEERALFEKIRTVDYRVVVATTEGMPSHRWTFCEQNLAPDRRGEPMFWYRRWSDRSLCTFYSIADEATGDDAVVARAEAMVQRLGARFGDVKRVVRWRYFPHVSANDMEAGFYDRLERLQGERATYYAGELLCFPTVETVTAYSADLVRRFFDARPVTPLPRASAWRS